MSRLSNILNKLAVNSIVDTGTSSGWSWRKYADGTAEMWKLSITNQACGTALGSAYRTANACVENFPFTFQEAPICNATPGNGQLHGVYFANVGVGQLQWYAIKLTKETQASEKPVELHVIGKLAT